MQISSISISIRIITIAVVTAIIGYKQLSG